MFLSGVKIGMATIVVVRGPILWDRHLVLPECHVAVAGAAAVVWGAAECHIVTTAARMASTAILGCVLPYLKINANAFLFLDIRPYVSTRDSFMK